MAHKFYNHLSVHGLKKGRNWNVMHIEKPNKDMHGALEVGIRLKAFEGHEKLEIRIKSLRQRFFLWWDTWVQHRAAFRRYKFKDVPPYDQDGRMIPLTYLDEIEWVGYITKEKEDENDVREVRTKSLPPVGGRPSLHQLRVFEVGGE